MQLLTPRQVSQQSALWRRALQFVALTMVCLWSAAAGAQNTLALTDAPFWMHYYCDSSEADPNGSFSTQGAHCYQNLTIPNGATLTVTGRYPASGNPQNLPIGAFFGYATGVCTIAGTINANALNGNNGNAGGAGGGGGGGASVAGKAGADSDLFGSASITRLAAGALGGAAGQNGGNAAPLDSSAKKFAWSKVFNAGTLGGGFGGSGGGATGSSGGAGGGGVILICGSIDFTGAINAAGANGAPGGGGIGGGGGGGGGVVIMATPNFVENTGTITVNGGTGGPGGSGAGSGGSGGPGWFQQFTLR